MYSPLWIDDTHLLAIARRLIDPSRPDAGAKWMLVGIDATTGARSDVLERVLAFDLSPDRTRVVYTAIESVAEQPLFIKTLAGGAPQRLLDSATTGLSGFHSPIFSPDGSSIYFGAHNIAPAVRSDQGARTLVAFTTHSAPDAIWRVSNAGGQPALLFQTELLEPYLAITPDAVDLYALSDDLYRFSVEATTGEVIDTPKAFSRVDYVD